ncbi:MAG: DUF6325 family protein [Thermomicrobiales bacterium]
MPMGPVELIILRFPGSEFTAGVADEINALIDSGLVRIIDMLFVMKDEDGTALVVSLDEMGETTALFVDPTGVEDELLLADADAQLVVPHLAPNTSAALILFENLWARKVAAAIRAADGTVVLNKRIPRAMIEQMLADSLA